MVAHTLPFRNPLRRADETANEAIARRIVDEARANTDPTEARWQYLKDRILAALTAASNRRDA